MRSYEELRAVCEEEKRKYEESRKAFFANPKNWSNNKRKMHGYSLRRGNLNKKYKLDPPCPPQFNFSIIFPMLEDIIDDTLSQEMSKHFNTFAEVKDMSGIGDIAQGRITEYFEENKYGFYRPNITELY